MIDGSEMVATPGFINGHLHISYAHATRGIFPDTLEPVDYLTNVFKLALQMSPEEEYHTSLLALTECLKYGTTTVVDPGTTRNPDVCMKAYEESGARVIIGASVTDLPNAINVPLIGLAGGGAADGEHGEGVRRGAGWSGAGVDDAGGRWVFVEGDAAGGEADSGRERDLDDDPLRELA